MGGRGLLAVCQFLGALGRLKRVLVQLRNCLTFKMPSRITLSIPDSANQREIGPAGHLCMKAEGGRPLLPGGFVLLWLCMPRRQF